MEKYLSKTSKSDNNKQNWFYCTDLGAATVQIDFHLEALKEKKWNYRATLHSNAKFWL